ncbi:hypothetical protein B0H12DRAFT_544169 [Mycena haematopus]|nr:hypothetical protein B0H12DRAFT_544169 [Mycena haematopus]
MPTWMEAQGALRVGCRLRGILNAFRIDPPCSVSRDIVCVRAASPSVQGHAMYLSSRLRSPPLRSCCLLEARRPAPASLGLGASAQVVPVPTAPPIRVPCASRTTISSNVLPRPPRSTVPRPPPPANREPSAPPAVLFRAPPCVSAGLRVVVAACGCGCGCESRAAPVRNENDNVRACAGTRGVRVTRLCRRAQQDEGKNTSTAPS